MCLHAEGYAPVVLHFSCMHDIMSSTILMLLCGIVSTRLTKDGLSHYRSVMELTQQLAYIVTVQYYNNSWHI